MIIRRDKSGLDATKFPTDLDVAWAAGIYEGEGCCVKSGGSKTKSFAVSVAQKDPELLYRMRDFFGGTVKEYPNERGTNKNGGKPVIIFAWRLCGDRARVFLGSIYPYLTARRRSQIDATSASRFLSQAGCAPIVPAPRSVSVAFFLEQVKKYVTGHKKRAFEKRNDYVRNHYQTKKLDPLWMEKRRAYTRAWRKRKSIQGKIVSIA